MSHKTKLFKYKKQQDQTFKLECNDTPDLIPQIRQEITIVNKQINDLELKRSCLEDKLRELSFNELPPPPQYQYSEVNSMTEQQLSDEYTYSQLDYQSELPQPPQQHRISDPKRALFEYFGYAHAQGQLESMDEISKLADLFGLKSNSIGKLKQHLKLIYQYLLHQEFPPSYHQTYNDELFNKLQL